MKQRRAKVIYAYKPQNQDELELKVSDVIDVIEEVEEGWWRGTLKGLTGVFPSNFVQELSDETSPVGSAFQQELSSALSKSGSSSDLDRSDSDCVDGQRASKNNSLSRSTDSDAEIKPKKVLGTNVLPFGNQLKSVLRSKADQAERKSLPTPAANSVTKRADTTNNNMSEPAPKLPPKPIREQAKVLFAYDAQNEDELSIKEGDVINIISKEIEDQGWWRGELNGKVGVFPDNFVELIKASSNEPQEPPRNKKPDRVLPTPTAGGDKPAVGSPPKPGITKPSDLKAAKDESSKGVLPFSFGKKKTTTTGGVATALGKTGGTAVPDVVPSQDKDMSTDNGEPVLLSNLTKYRPQGPQRRPPSSIYVPKEDEDGLENGDTKHDKGNAISKSKSLDQPETNGNGTMAAAADAKSSQPTPSTVKSQVAAANAEPAQPLPPWMIELQNKQEKRKGNSHLNSPADAPTTTAADAPKESATAATVVPGPKPTMTPFKSSPSRTSGDFTKLINKLEKGGAADAPASAADSDSNPISILKPTKPLKQTGSALSTTPPSTTAAATAPSATSTLSATATLSQSTTSNQSQLSTPSVSKNSSPIARPGSNNAIRSAEPPVTAPAIKDRGLTSSTTTAASGDVASGDATSGSVSREQYLKLQEELKQLKETMVTRKDYEDLLKQVNELKESFESHKTQSRTMVTGLINEVAEERKKLATLQIEVDRLRAEKQAPAPAPTTTKSTVKILGVRKK